MIFRARAAARGSLNFAMPSHAHPGPDEHDTRLRCPKDATIMERIGVGNFTVDRCASCGSMWLDALELPRVLARHDAVDKLDIGAIIPRDAHPPLDGLRCPRDKSALIDMVDADQPHVHTSACTVCGGILLDAGELRDLAEFSLRERITRLFNL